VERTPGRTRKAVLLIWAGLLAMTFSGRMYSTDILAQYEVAGSLAGLRPFMTVSGDHGWIVEGRRPGHFVPHAPGYSVLLVPAALAGEAMGLEAGKVAAGLVNCSLSLALVGFWYGAARRRYGEVPVPRFILVAAGSMALVYGRMNFDVERQGVPGRRALRVLHTRQDRQRTSSSALPYPPPGSPQAGGRSGALPPAASRGQLVQVRKSLPGRP